MQEELIQEFQAGNKQAGEDFYNANRGLIFTTIRKCACSTVDIEEVTALVNQAFVHCLVHFDKDNAMFSTYFIATSKGIVRNFLRDKAFTIRPSRKDFQEGKIIPCGSLEQIIYQGDGDEIKLIDVQATTDDYTQIIVDEILSKVNKTDRETFILQYKYGLTQMQIAEIMGTNQVTVSRRIARAKTRLKAILAA